MRRLACLALGAASACVYPSGDPTGVELSWRFVEHNNADGEEAIAGRTCAGAQAEQINFAITDADDEFRHAILRYDCSEGYQTADTLQIAASDAFVQLRPGTYGFEVSVLDDATDPSTEQRLEVREVIVEKRRVTVQTWQFSRAPIDWTLDLRGTDTCSSLALALDYASPQGDLPEFVPADDDAPVPYRRGLVSASGLPLSGQIQPCDTLDDEPHAFSDLDRGEYILDLQVDGQACPVLIDLRAPDDATSVIDLANLPCGG